MSLFEDRAAINCAAQQAWIGFWQSCMRGVGASSALSFDTDVVAQALNGHDPEPEPEILPPPRKRPPAPLIPLRGKSAWAQQLEGDERTSGITLGDVLVGLEDYFKIFRQMRRANPAAYAYFRRVGAPLCFENSAVWAEAIERDTEPPIVNRAELPGYLGLFMAKSRERERDDILNDKPSLLDFHLYEKRRRNIEVASPWKYIIYDHQEYNLDRGVLTRAERKKFPHANMFSFHYYIGIDDTGLVRALPMRMNRYQTLRDGEQICHSQFIVPPGLHEIAGKLTADQYVAKIFTVIRSFCASAMSGVQISVKRGDEVARFGIPLSYVRGFFRDREREGLRRKPLLHLVGEYSYVRDNRVVTVGEHLRGARKFKWRDHEIVVSAPGIHHPAPEALTSETLNDDDLLPMPDNVVPLGKVAKIVQQRISDLSPAPIRKGMPVSRYKQAHLEVPDAPGRP